MNPLSWFMDNASPAGIAGSVGEQVVEGALHGVADIIKIFKLPPEQLLLAEQKFGELQASLREIALKDRDSARQREMTLKDSTPKILAFCVVGGFLTMTIALITTALFHYTVDPISAGLIGTLVGYLSAKSELILAYYFGSSAGSDKKTDLLNQRASEPPHIP